MFSLHSARTRGKCANTRIGQKCLDVVSWSATGGSIESFILKAEVCECWSSSRTRDFKIDVGQRTAGQGTRTRYRVTATGATKVPGTLVVNPTAAVAFTFRLYGPLTERKRKQKCNEKTVHHLRKKEKEKGIK